VCLLDAVTARFPAAVAEWVRRHQITVWYSVPSALVPLLPRLQAAGVQPRFRAVLFAGEVFPSASLRAWREWLPEAEFYNLYGPTETNVCTWYRLPRRAEEIPDPLPIGVACPNFVLEILDEQHHPVAAGEQGYLWARGPGLLTGYWGNAQRTEASLLFRETAGGVTERLYNTGDVVSQAADGLLRFHGRRDDQVKCRGYRVSLLEVQETLLACPGVRQAAVVALPDAQNGTRLYGFVARATAELSATEVLAFCGRRLPAYMIPDQIEIRLQLPETSTGKVDRPRLVRELQERARGSAA
jgi:acyl-coenzyme A synthetase/AMP-(fatty) acid ligase